MERKRLYIYKLRGTQYKKGYIWILRIYAPAPAKGEKQRVLLTKTSVDLDLLVRFRNQHLREFYPHLWRKVKDIEGMFSQPKKPEVPYNYNILPQGSSTVL